MAHQGPGIAAVTTHIPLLDGPVISTRVESVRVTGWPRDLQGSQCVRMPCQRAHTPVVTSHIPLRDNMVRRGREESSPIQGQAQRPTNVTLIRVTL
jgi:hypothetical protein